MKSRFGRSGAIISAFMMASPLGYAQSSAEATSTGDFMLEEIIVTARRRAETQTEVPVSISAYSSDFMQRQNIQSFTDYATKIPNVTFQYGAGGDSAGGFTQGRLVTIRGISGRNTTAFYIDDTPVPSAVSPQVLNLDRIEVLKGPQGTLFGASSMGGNLRYITREPSLTENSGVAQAGAGTTKGADTDVDVNAGGNIVIIPDKLAINAAVGYLRESGVITRRYPDDSGALVSEDGQGENDTWSASVSMKVALTDRLDARVSFIGQKTELDGLPVAYTPLPDYKILSYTVDRDRDVQEYNKDRWAMGSFVLNYGGDDYSIISSTSYFGRTFEEMVDTTEGANEFIEAVFEESIGDPAFPNYAGSRNRQLTHETRFAFDQGMLLPNLSGVVGVFYQRDSIDPIGPEPIFVPELAESGFFDGGYLAAQEGGDSRNTQTAVFGEIYYEFMPGLTATLGLRQYWIEQETDASLLYGLLFNGDEPLEDPALDNKQSGLVPKAVLSYEIGDRGTVYASAAKGFRVGGAQSGLPAICDADLANLGISRADTRDYDSDNLWSYEVGAKNNFADGRLAVSGAAFQIDWTDIQQDVSLPGCNFSFTGNAGEARVRGAEIEISGQPVAKVPLTISMGVGYADGTLTDPGLLPMEADTKLVQVPTWTASLSGYYETPISDIATLFVAADYSFTDSVQVVDGDGGFVTRQAFGLFNANVGVRFGDTTIRLYGRNLMDEEFHYGDIVASGFERTEVANDGSVQAYPQAAVSRPRQLGVQVNMEF